jgi:thioredoxin 1
MINIREINNVEEFHNFIRENDNNLRIVKLGTPWCGPCKVLENTLLNLDITKLDNVLFAESNIDTDDTEEIGVELGIRGVPVIVFYKNGEELKRHVGVLQADEIYKIIDELK